MIKAICRADLLVDGSILISTCFCSCPELRKKFLEWPRLSLLISCSEVLEIGNLPHNRLLPMPWTLGVKILRALLVDARLSDERLL